MTEKLDVESSQNEQVKTETDTKNSTDSSPFTSPLFQLLLAQKVYELGDKEETFNRITNDINEHPLLLDQIPEIENNPISREQCYKWYLEQLESEGLEQGKGQWIMQLAQVKYDNFVAQLEKEIEQDAKDFVEKVGEVEELTKN